MRVNPFTITSASNWPLQHREGGKRATEVTEVTEQLQEEELQQLACLLGRLLDAAECEPELYEALPWLRKVSLWELLLKRWADARCPYVRRSARSTQPSNTPNSLDSPHPWDLPDPWNFTKMPNSATTATGTRAAVDTAMPQTAATLLTFFEKVTQPMEEMVEARYLSSLLRNTRTVWEILRRMARYARVMPLSEEVVIALCANLTRNRLITRSQCRPRPHPAIWTITWRSIQTQLRWPTQPPAQRSIDTGDIGRVGRGGRARNSLLVLVREEITLKAGVGYQQTGKVLAFRCLPDPTDLWNNHASLGSGLSSGSRETAECIQTAMALALYDALVFSRSRDGDFTRHIEVPTLLRVQAPVPQAIRKASSIWGSQVESTREPQRPGREGANQTRKEWETWETWENELAGRVLDPFHYMRILDRALERTYGYAPLLTKQRVTRYQGWRWSMHPERDPLLLYVGLQELLPSYPAVVGDDGSIEWQGWHYRDYKEDVLRYFPNTQVRVRRSPLTEAVIVVYWRRSVLCYAVAEELRHEDGTCRSYWFPHQRLGE